MNRLKVNKVIMYINAQTEFPFDTIDVQDEFSKVLEYYSLQGDLTGSEQGVVQQELLKLAGVAQTAEMARMVHRQLNFESKCSKSQHVKMKQSIAFMDWLKSLPEDLQVDFFSSVAIQASVGG